jgi:hypothetical protein
MQAEPTEEDLQRQLAGEALTGPRIFRERTLAPLSMGLRDVFRKVTRADDTGTFFDLLLLEVLARAYGETPEAKLAARRELILATDDVAGFRAEVSILAEDFTDSDLLEARRLADEILGIVAAAEVALVEKKSSAVVAEAAPSPTRKPSSSGASRAKRAGRRTSSAGS